MIIVQKYRKIFWIEAISQKSEPLIGIRIYPKKSNAAKENDDDQ